MDQPVKVSRWEHRLQRQKIKSSRHLIVFPHGSSMVSAVSRWDETHRYTVIQLLHQSSCRDITQNKDKRHDEPGLRLNL